MDRRLQLHDILSSLISNVYFQPPPTVNLIYPCIVYKRGFIDDTTFANDKPYTHRVRYTLTIIDRDPDSPLLAKVADLPMCKFERHYTADNLNHDVYNLYY